MKVPWGSLETGPARGRERWVEFQGLSSLSVSPRGKQWLCELENQKGSAGCYQGQASEQRTVGLAKNKRCKCWGKHVAVSTSDSLKAQRCMPFQKNFF